MTNYENIENMSCSANCDKSAIFCQTSANMWPTYCNITSNLTHSRQHLSAFRREDCQHARTIWPRSGAKLRRCRRSTSPDSFQLSEQKEEAVTCVFPCKHRLRYSQERALHNSISILIFSYPHILKYKSNAPESLFRGLRVPSAASSAASSAHFGTHHLWSTRFVPLCKRRHQIFLDGARPRARHRLTDS